MRIAARIASVAAAIAFAGTAAANDHAVKITKKEGVGSYLTDRAGKALYTFKKDMPGMSHCEGMCAERWPIFFREKVEAKDGLQATDFATITRADGKKQTTYKGMPLYYFAADGGPGDCKGHQVNQVWFAAAP